MSIATVRLIKNIMTRPALILFFESDRRITNKFAKRNKVMMIVFEDKNKINIVINASSNSRDILVIFLIRAHFFNKK